ncbi:DUF4097 family beta strand repeat-containing protein [Rubrivirga sp. S365]|uniref:DUF4097 family beta strand repeat-containing protein n=1 Tax=Rubrivirga litoralis TaxID=3075598 RepID=A0ABU3BNC6_9BACT|nr:MULTISPECIES: DUF4097 family beta strand repeat-containing protein [unclassified Rubrivirga]MDT0630725.1 DUF4097 family beta strand repeat-containing protein [Rubrivirga sp. F394]MDT7856395.1 DUF4097 family beta strand repeat-containing protein [Rubrivirga sp. S365]
MLRLLPALLFLTAAACATAQPTRTLAGDDWCDDVERGWGGDRDERFGACEVREVILPAGSVAVGGRNGAITVRPWDRPDVLVRARVSARGRTQAEADRRLRAARLDVGRDAVRERPPRRPNDGDVVAYEVFAPRQTNLSLRTMNGAISVEGMAGALDVQTMNGGLSLRDVAGAVRARTMNGGIDVAVGGRGGVGAGLDLETANGGISVALPRGYSADVVASTQMGQISTEGVALDAERRDRGQFGDRLAGQIGAGGPTLSAVTQRGGISIRAAR